MKTPPAEFDSWKKSNSAARTVVVVAGRVSLNLGRLTAGFEYADDVAAVASKHQTPGRREQTRGEDICFRLISLRNCKVVFA